MLGRIELAEREGHLLSREDLSFNRRFFLQPVTHLAPSPE